jgi:uncharacterized membrane protein
MQKEWEGSIYVQAPVDKVFSYLADVSRHPEWDVFAARVTQLTPGNEQGEGSEWEVHERLNLVVRGKREPRWKNGAGITHRQLREVVANRRVSWHSHPVPKVGISADFAWELAPEGAGTRVTQRVTVHVPGLVDTVGKLVARNLDQNLQQQWEKNLENLKSVAEGARVPHAASV